MKIEAQKGQVTAFERRWASTPMSKWSVTARFLLTPTFGIDLHPTTPTIVYAGVDNEGYGGSGVDAVYKSTNGGGSWMQLAAGNDCVMDVIVNLISPTEVYANGCHGVFLKSVDEGATGGPPPRFASPRWGEEQ